MQTDVHITSYPTSEPKQYLTVCRFSIKTASYVRPRDLYTFLIVRIKLTPTALFQDVPESVWDNKVDLIQIYSL